MKEDMKKHYEYLQNLRKKELIKAAKSIKNGGKPVQTQKRIELLNKVIQFVESGVPSVLIKWVTNQRVQMIRDVMQKQEALDQEFIDSSTLSLKEYEEKKGAYQKEYDELANQIWFLKNCLPNYPFNFQISFDKGKMPIAYHKRSKNQIAARKKRKEESEKNVVQKPEKS